MNGAARRTLLVWLAAVLFLAVTQFSGLTQIAAQSGSLVVTDQEVTSEFPTGLRFTLSAVTEAPIERADLLFSVGTNPTLYQSTVRFAATTDVEIEYPLELLNLGIPPGLILSYHWRLHTGEGETLQNETQSIEWIDNRFDWTLYQTDDVNLYAYAGNDGFFDQTTAVAQETVDEYQARFSAPERPEPINIWLYESQQDLSGTLAPNSREWIGGVSYANFSLIAAVTAAGEERAMLRIVPHEVVHQIFYDATLNPFNNPPAWLDEGLAVVGQRAGTEGFDEIVDVAYSDGSLPSLRSMISEWGSDRRSVSVSYAASYSVVTFIMETMGEDAIPALTEAYRQGLSHEEAMIRALGMTTEELDILWRQHIDEKSNS